MSRTTGDVNRAGRRATKDAVSGADELLHEVREGIAAASLDCSCRELVDQVIDRVSRARRAQQQSAALRDARQKRNGIAALLKLLADIDEITGAEPDRGVFEEAVALFEDIGALAAAGAAAARKAGATACAQQENPK